MKLYTKYDGGEIQERIYLEIMKRKTKGQVLATIVFHTEIQALAFIDENFELWYKNEHKHAMADIAKKKAGSDGGVL